MPVRDAHRSLAVLMATCLVLALAASLAACSGAPEERPAPAATAPPAAPQPTATPSPPAVAIPSPTPVATVAPTGTPSPTPVATVAPTGTPSPTPDATVAPTGTPSPTPAATAAPTGTPSPTPDATAAPIATPSPTPTADAAPTETPSPPSTASPTPAAAPAEMPTTFRYDTYDTTGEVAEPGSYAFLEDPADTTSAVTTYEALRDGTTTALLIHKSDAHGASQAALYDAVEAGDLFEWREADDCFVRYKVTEVKPDPSGTVPRKLLAVEWMTYAYTGCSGAISADAEVGMTSGNMLDFGGVGLRAPVVHGTHHLIPSTWEGETEATTRHEPDTPPKQEETGASTLAEVRALHLPYWREPTLPEGWILDRAWEGGLHAPWKGFCSVYLTEPLQFPDGKERQKGIEVCGAYNTVRKFAQKASFYADQGASPDGLIVRETRVIAGRPAVILWSPPGPNYLWNADVRIYIDDPKTETSYSITVAAPHRSDLAADGNAKLEKAIALATSLFESPSALPPPTTFRYDTYDTTGEVAEPGSYAFLADPADATSAVTTYEALRDGTTTALLIHKSDAHGASQAALYDAVEPGDLFEWREADDCFVRYKVTEVKPDPAGAVPRKLLAVEWMTYAFTGCSGTVSADTVATVDWGELPDLGGASLTVPIRHGTWQLVPVGWAGAIELDRLDLPPVQSIDLYRDDPEGFFSTADPVVARRELPYWRDPALPAGLRLYRADSGTWDGPLYGYCAEWGLSDRYGPAIHICGYHAAYSGLPTTASQLNGRLAYMTGVVAGRAAMLEYYSPAGSNQAPTVLYGLRIYDVATQSGYELHVEDPSFDVIAITRSLFEPPNPLPPQTALRYDRYDLTGEVAEPGSYAFLSDPADTTSAVTTYEALRDGSATALRIHQADAGGVSRAAFLDTVEAEHLVEWQQADDCFVRYRVTEVPGVAPTAAYREFRVRPETYAWQSCQTGSLPAGESAVQFSAGSELPLEHLGGTNLTDFAVVHGVRQLVPEGVLLPNGRGAPDSSIAVEPMRRRELTPLANSVPHVSTGDLVEARSLPYWREPRVPEGWRFAGVRSGGYEDGLDGYIAAYAGPQGQLAVTIMGAYASGLPMPADASWTVNDGKYLIVNELRMIAGRPATVNYSPLGPTHDDGAYVSVEVYDHATGAGYTVDGRSGSLGLLGGPDAAERVIAIARSLFEPPNPLPPPTTFRYDRYDTTGEVAEPGSYAFLADPADTTSAVTTYEALRDGTTTALLIHKSDAHGASQAALYDAVEAGDLFEWREADDCFVRYKVTEVKPDPAGAVPRKLLAVEWMTYAFTGCRAGAVSASAAATVDWGELPDLGGTSLAAPVRHGPFQIIPEDWGGVRSFEEYDEPPDLPANSLGSDGYFHTTDLATAKRHAYWRDPALPAGWTFMEASSGGLSDPLHGYCARWNNERGYPGVEICGYYITGTVGGFPASSTWPLEGDPLGQNVHETRIISGRPAVVDYSPRGPLFNDFAEVEVHVYDTATGIAYLIWGQGPLLLGDSVDAGIAIARSLFESANPLPPQTTFRYDTYDLTDEVAEPGSYAFLLADEGSTTAAATWVDVVNHSGTTQLRVHSTDAEGTSQAPFYDEVAVGDEFDWWMSRRCYFRFRVTELLPDVPGADMRKTFAVEQVTADIFECSTERQVPAEFRWNPPEALRGRDGVLQMITGVPVSGGRTYRLAPWSPVTIDVPEGMRLLRYTTFVLNPDGTWTVGLEDVASGSYLKLDMLDGTEHGRHIEAREGDARDVSALFDRIVESVHVDY